MQPIVIVSNGKLKLNITGGHKGQSLLKALLIDHRNNFGEVQYLSIVTAAYILDYVGVHLDTTVHVCTWAMGKVCTLLVHVCTWVTVGTLLVHVWI